MQIRDLALRFVSRVQEGGRRGARDEDDGPRARGGGRDAREEERMPETHRDSERQRRADEGTSPVLIGREKLTEA